MEFRILGPVEVVAEGTPLRISGSRTRAVLGMLLVQAGQVVAADRLAGELWPGLTRSRAMANLQVRVSELRRILRASGAGERVVTRPPGYAIELGDAEVDTLRFAALLEAAQRALAAGDAATASESARAALALWRGPALADLPDLPFVRAEAARLGELRLTALETRLEADLAGGRHGEVLGELAALTTEHPLRERLWSQRIRALYAAGRQAEALAAYRELRQILSRDLGLEPSPQLRDLERRVLVQDRSLPADGDVDAAPVTRYVRAGDIHVAYQVIGEHGPDLVFIPGIFSHLDLWWEDRHTADFLRRLASFGRLIMFDKRDTGLSDPASGPDTLEQRMDDVRAVMDACRSRRAVLVGYSEGGPMSILFAATHPDRVAGLVLCGAAARWSAAADYPCGRESAAMLDALERVARHEWGQGNTIDWYAPSRAGSSRARQAIARRERMSVSPSAFLRMLRMVRGIDVREVLPAVTVPALVVQRLDDRITPRCHGRYLAEHLPDARYLEQPGDHLLWLGDTDELVTAIGELVERAHHRTEPHRMLTTILVADLSGPADPDARSAVERHRGQVLEAAERTLIASFDGPARAIQCALALRGKAGTDLRAGVHAGEVELRGGVRVGAAIELTKQVAAVAEPGEILISRTVKDLVIGSDLRFYERGEHRFAQTGDERWMVLAVRDN